MVKKIISVATAFLMLCCMVPFYAFAESATCPKCGKDTLITNQDISVEIGEEVGLPLSLKRAYCSTCHYAKYEYNVLGVAGEQAYDDGDESHIINFLKSLKEQLLGKNSTATKFTPGGGSTSGGGVGRPKGYADDNGSADINHFGEMAIKVPSNGIWGAIGVNYGYTFSNYKDNFDTTATYVELSPSQYKAETGKPVNGVRCEPNYMVKAPYTGIYKVYSPYVDSIYGTYQYVTNNILNSGIANLNRLENRTINSSAYVDNNSEAVQIFCNKGDEFWALANIAEYFGSHTTSSCIECSWFKLVASPYVVAYVNVLSEGVSNKTSITINNNTWNGNIYVDNSNNLTYIYPQYTTVNEKNETVTNISNTPIIYNNETKQYYTYDQTTKNYYYITYNTQPTPSPSPTPAPTEKPGGSISTPETGKPGGDTGDTTGILAVLVEIRDNMIQGFLDIKAAFVAGFAELSANFTLAIENLNVNIQNVFNKKFPDQSTPETALPSPTPSPSPAPTDPPSPSPAPTDQPSPSPAPDPGKPDSGDKTNNFWTIIFPNGGGSEDGKKGIFWALVSLILALIAFFSNLAVGVGYLFPFLPDGVVMTINTCLIVIFLFTIIKFIMRSK